MPSCLRLTKNPPHSMHDPRTRCFFPRLRTALAEFFTAAIILASTAAVTSAAPSHAERNYLYVASPSLGRQLERGGHGVLVFDIDDGHKFVKRLPAAGLNRETRLPLSLKGIVASAETNRLWVSSMETMFCIDLLTGKLLWEKRYEGGCDRMAVSPD